MTSVFVSHFFNIAVLLCKVKLGQYKPTMFILLFHDVEKVDYKFNIVKYRPKHSYWSISMNQYYLIGGFILKYFKLGHLISATIITVVDLVS